MNAVCSLVRDEGLSCILYVLYGGLGISKLQFLIKKDKNIFQLYSSSSVFGHQNPGSGLDPDSDSFEKLDTDPDSMNPDPQLCLQVWVS